MSKYLIFCALFVFFLCSPTNWAFSQVIQQETYLSGEEVAPIPYGVTVTARVAGEFWLELQGWTSPWADVELTMGRLVKKETTANEFGEFVFRTVLPRTLEPFCLIATDVSEITSHPLCIAPPPPSVNILVKEIVMPPTLKIDKGKIAKGETVAAQGYTTPNSPVLPYLFEEKPRPRLMAKWLNGLIAPALAAEVPKPKVESNQAGFFQLNLPSEEIGKNRIFVGSIFLNNPSPKSTTLTFDVLSWWRMLLERIIAFLANLFWLLVRFLTTPAGIILAEVGIILILIAFLITQKSRSPSA